jgi:hypothetical protein
VWWTKVAYLIAARKQRVTERGRDKALSFQGMPPVTHFSQLGPTFTVPPPPTVYSNFESINGLTHIGDQDFNTEAFWGEISYPDHKRKLALPAVPRAEETGPYRELCREPFTSL